MHSIDRSHFYFFTLPFFLAICCCVAPGPDDLIELGFFDSLYSDSYYFFLSVLCLVFINELFSVASHFSASVSFIPFRIPLNMCRRASRFPRFPFEPRYGTLFMLYLATAGCEVILLTILGSRTLDHFLMSSVLVFSHTLGSIPALLSEFLVRFSFLCFSTYCHLSFELTAFWLFGLLLLVCGDVHPNPGPLCDEDEFSSGFLSFCNWNLNSLAVGDFRRITLLNAENTIYKYDIILV